MNASAPQPFYVAFVDEAGDPGLSAVRPIDKDGSTEWLCLGAVVMRVSDEQTIPAWISTIKSKAEIRGAADLHFRNLPHFRKAIVCSELAKLPLRAFVIASNKKNMRRHHNPRAAQYSSQQWFYNFCLRLLLERVTQFCHEHAQSQSANGRFLKLVYSERGGHSYGQTIAYHELLKNQAKAGKLYLTKRRIYWEVLDWRLAEAVSHKSSGGAQLADVVTSAFYQAVDTLPPIKWDNSFAKLLKPVMTKEDGRFMNFGVALHPTPPSKGKLTAQQKEIFEYYGYAFYP